MTDLDPDLSARLRSAYQGRSPSPDQKAQMLRALQASLVAGGLTAGAAQAAPSALKLWLSKHALTWSLIGLGAGAVAGGGVWVAREVSQQPASLQPVPTCAASCAPAHSGVGSGPAPAASSTWSAWSAASNGLSARAQPEEPTLANSGTQGSALASQRALGVPSAPVPDAMPRAQASIAPRSGPPAPSEGAPRQEAVSKDDLAAEAALLQRAHAAYRSGKPGDALALVREHVARFPRSQLTVERSTLKVLALCASDRIEEARRAASGLRSSAALRGSCVDQ